MHFIIKLSPDFRLCVCFFSFSFSFSLNAEIIAKAVVVVAHWAHFIWLLYMLTDYVVVLSVCHEYIYLFQCTRCQYIEFNKSDPNRSWIYMSVTATAIGKKNKIKNKNEQFMVMGIIICLINKFQQFCFWIFSLCFFVFLRCDVPMSTSFNTHFDICCYRFNQTIAPCSCTSCLCCCYFIVFW